MFDRLHPKMRGIGEIELVQPSIQIYMQVSSSFFGNFFVVKFLKFGLLCKLKLSDAANAWREDEQWKTCRNRYKLIKFDSFETPAEIGETFKSLSSEKFFVCFGNC